MVTLDFQEQLRETYQKTRQQIEKLKVSTCFSHTCQTLSKSSGVLESCKGDLFTY